MKYKEIKESLYKNGFKITSNQTDSYINMPGFSHSVIKGDVYVSFDECEFEDGIYIDYESSEFLNDIEIKCVLFEIDKSISYLSNDIIPLQDCKNSINLYKEDIDKYFHDVLKIVVDKYFFIDFSELYHEKIKTFNNKIKKFFPILDKYPFDMNIFKISGDEETLFSDVQVQFSYKGGKYNSVWFDLKCISWDMSIHMSLDCLNPININVDEIDEQKFDELLLNQIKECEKQNQYLIEYYNNK